MSVPIYYKGKLYDTIKEFCEEHDINYRTFHKYWAQGLSAEEILKSRRQIHYKGVNYPSLTALCREVGLNYHTIRNRIEKGKSIEEAIKMPIRSINRAK